MLYHLMSKNTRKFPNNKYKAWVDDVFIFLSDSTNGLKISIQKQSIKLIHVHDVVPLKINYKHDLIIIISKIKTIRPNDTLKKVNHKIHTD